MQEFGDGLLGGQFDCVGEGSDVTKIRLPKLRKEGALVEQRKAAGTAQFIWAPSEAKSRLGNKLIYSNTACLSRG